MDLNTFDKLARCARQEQPPAVDVTDLVADRIHSIAVAPLRGRQAADNRRTADGWGVDNRWMAVCTAAALAVAVLVSTLHTSSVMAEADDPWGDLVEPVVVLQ